MRVLSLVEHRRHPDRGTTTRRRRAPRRGPGECWPDNARLVFGRVTGWGQSGPYAHTAGHDITYLATTGALHAIGRAGERPVPPVNLLGDFGGGGMLLAFGVLCAVIHARESGRGQIVDAAIVDGAVSLTSMLHGLMASGGWEDTRGVNLFDGGAPFYDTYECADGRYVAVGALEAKFFTTLAERLGLADDPAFTGDHLDRARWPAIRARLTETFLSRARDDWSALLRRRRVRRPRALAERGGGGRGERVTPSVPVRRR